MSATCKFRNTAGPSIGHFCPKKLGKDSTKELGFCDSVNTELCAPHRKMVAAAVEQGNWMIYNGKGYYCKKKIPVDLGAGKDSSDEIKQEMAKVFSSIGYTMGKYGYIKAGTGTTVKKITPETNLPMSVENSDASASSSPQSVSPSRVQEVKEEPVKPEVMVYYPKSVKTESFIQETSKEIIINVKAIRSKDRSARKQPEPEIVIESEDEIEDYDSEEEYDSDEDVIVGIDDEPKLTPEEEDQLERQIVRYYQSFSYLAVELPIQSRGNLSAQKWILELRQQVALSSGTNFIQSGFHHTMKAAGMLLEVEPHFSDILNPKTDAEIRDLLKDLELQYGPDIAKIPPEQRLAGRVIFAMIQAYQTKLQLESIGQRSISQ